MTELLNTDPAVIQGWAQVLVLLVGIVKALRAQSERSRWEKIRAVIPDAHRLAQKVSRLTPTRKDDEFVKQAGRLLEMAGVVLKPSEVGAVKAMGEAEHQDYKLMRDGAEPDPVGDAVAETLEALAGPDAEGNGPPGSGPA
jgi:hypothetical protein